MPALDSCPPIFELEQFLLGRLADEDSQTVESHLNNCTECQKQLPTLTAVDEFVEALRTRPSTITTEPESAVDLVRLLVPHFKQIASAFDETFSLASGQSNSDTPLLVEDFRNWNPVDDSDRPRCIGRYEIRGVLGSGGMGTVLHGYDPLLKRSVAIKVIHAKLLADAGMRERLIREAQAAAAVEHDNIVAVYAVETHAGDPCIVMPLLRGMSLRQCLEANAGPQPLSEILRIGQETASGLAAAHAVGLIHCDIKPANLWLEAPHGRVKVLDFGLAVAGGGEDVGATGISGTPGYLAPEQARGLALDQRTDVFSLGCVLYRIATGTAPFAGDRQFRSLWTVLSAAPVPVIQLNPSVPRELSDLIGRMLAQDPNQRPASAAAVLKVFDELKKQILERQRKLLRRKWLVALLLVALFSGSAVGLWGIMNAPPTVVPVETTFVGDEPPVSIILRHEGEEQTLTLGRKKYLSLPPGDYFLKPATEQPGRRLIPERFTVIAGKPGIMRIALVGEVSQHTTHTQPVTGVAVIESSNPMQVLSVGLDRALVSWEPSSIKSPQFVELPHAAHCLAISPNGQEIVTGGGNKQPAVELAIRRWDVNRLVPSGDPLEGHTRIVRVLDYSSDGKFLASAGADGVLLWNLLSGESQPLKSEDNHSILALAFSPNGQELVTGSDEGRIVVWSLKTRGISKTWDGGPTAIRSVVFLTERLVTGGDDGIVRIWKNGNLEQEWLGHAKPVLTVATSSNGRQVLSADAGGSLRMWSVLTGQTIHTWQSNESAINTIVFTANARQAVTGGADGVTRLWQLPFCD